MTKGHRRGKRTKKAVKDSHSSETALGRKRETVKTDHLSESHRIEHELKEVRSKLHEVNKEIRPARSRGHRARMTAIMIWLVIVLLFSSLLINSVGVFMIAKYSGAGERVPVVAAADHNEGIQVLTDNETEPMTGSAGKTTQSPANYHGVMLGRFKTEKQEYYTGEEAASRAIIILNDREKLKAEVEYRLTDMDGKKIYSYSDEVEAYGNNSMLRKTILLTENYPAGNYTIDFKARFDVDGKRYLLPGKTTFELKERPEDPYMASLGRGITRMWWWDKILLILVILLNLILIYNSYKYETEFDKER